MLGVTLATVATWGGWFYWNNLRGAGPALLPPAGNIVKLIEDQEKTPGINSTGMPLKLPQGFSISIFAKDLVDPRVMAYDGAGNMLVSIPSQGKVIALPDTNNDFKAEAPIVVADKLNNPHGIAMKCMGDGCALYIAESNQLSEYDYDLTTLKASNKKKLLDLPEGGRHITRTLMFLPAPNESKLLISVGSSCDVCNEKDARRASILVYDTATSTTAINYANGLRNSVFMTLNPVDGKVWATEMGRDELGDDTPPDEINIIEQGKNYGWPICYGQKIHDNVFDKRQYIRDPCIDTQASHIDIPAHSAPLGLAFFPEEGWPEQYWHDLLVAYHGSWNRSVPTGYKIVRYHLDNKGNVQSSEDFITGWLTDKGEALGRPVDILIQPGGVIYVSDDKAGVIYRITSGASASSQQPVAGSRTLPNPEITSIKSNETIKSPLVVEGKAVGGWFFEASFPIQLQDEKGVVLGTGIAQASGDWMTDAQVPFKAIITFKQPSKSTKGFLVFKKDNPSGLEIYDQQFKMPVIIAPASSVGSSLPACKVGGCSGQICSDTETISTCIYQPEFACYKNATCARQADGLCGWTPTKELTACLKNPPTSTTPPVY